MMERVSKMETAEERYKQQLHDAVEKAQQVRHGTNNIAALDLSQTLPILSYI